MNTLLTIQAIGSGGLIGLLLRVAIACIIIWAIWALLQWAGITIPRPIIIIAIALISILIIIWLFQIFGSLVQDTPVHPRQPCPPPCLTWDGHIVKHGQPL